MWSNGFLITLDIPSSGAGWCRAFPGLLAGIALCGVAGADLPLVWRVVLGLGVLTLALVTLYRDKLAPESQVVRAVTDGAGRWTLHTGIGGRCRARLLRSWLAGPVAGLQWRGVDGRQYTAWLVARRADWHLWRRLRVRLRNPLDDALS